MTIKPELGYEVAGLERVVAVMTYMRSGSGLMSSLLDSHPNAIATPDCILTGFYEFWDEYGHFPTTELVPTFVDYYGTIFDAREPTKCPRAGKDFGTYANYTNLGPGQDECMVVDRETFEKVMLDIIGGQETVSRKLFFQALHVAYSRAIGQEAQNPIIAYGLHIAKPEIIKQFLQDFPQAKFLQMVRDPISALGSTFRSRINHGITNPLLGVGVVTGALYHGIPVPLNNAANWRSVKLEDLHQKPGETMKKLSDWLEIPWDDSLLASTINGKQWWNEKNTISISGFSPAVAAQRFEEFIPAFDRIKLDILLGFKSRVWGYSKRGWTRSRFAQFLALPLILLPFRLERISITASINAAANRPSFAQRTTKTLSALFQGRKVILRAWHHCQRRGPKEVRLL